MSEVQNRNILSREDLISMILGLAIVGIVMVVLVNYFKSRSGRIDLEGLTSNTTEESSNENDKVDVVTSREYVVEKGDSLWKIAQKKYNDGYKWVEVAQANNIELTQAGSIEIGDKLQIPNSIEEEVKANLPTNYQVKVGDSLSKIALSYYGDMFVWNKIFEANKSQISNPNLIQPGLNLVIPE